MVVNAKEAVEAALAYVANIYSREGISDVLLEEIELSADDRVWHVTVSFLRPTTNPLLPLSGDIAKALGQGKRVYKVVLIDAATKAVRAMKIREFTGSVERP